MRKSGGAGGIGAELGEDPPVLEVGEAVLDRRPSDHEDALGFLLARNELVSTAGGAASNDRGVEDVVVQAAETETDQRPEVGGAQAGQDGVVVGGGVVVRAAGPGRAGRRISRSGGLTISPPPALAPNSKRPAERPPQLQLYRIADLGDVVGEVLKPNRGVQSRDDFPRERLEVIDVLDCFQGRCHLVVVPGELQIGLGTAFQQEPEQPLSTVCVLLVLARHLNVTALPLGVRDLPPQAHGGSLNTVGIEEGNLPGEGPQGLRQRVEQTRPRRRMATPGRR